MVTIFIVSTDQNLRDILAQGHSNYHVRMLDSVDNLINAARTEIPDLIVVDLYDCTSEGACRRVRAQPGFGRLPILCIVEQCSAQDIASVLDSGGDDCLRRPYVGRELAARVRALLRRNRRPAFIAPLVLDRHEKSAILYGSPIDLTPTEYDLLDALCDSPGEHLTATDLLVRVWNYPPGVGDPALVRNHVRNLRRKLERDPNRPRIVVSAHGRGYTVSINTERR